MKDSKINIFPKSIYKDIAAGIICALVSIPISMGYAQIAGLPAVYGLYGSVLPILLFGILSSSRDRVFGVDAAPAAMVGSMVASLGIPFDTGAAVDVVPMITLMVSAWLFVLYIIKAGKIFRYISKPVMGGFVTGICIEIIFMQLPKLYGGAAGTGEIIELIENAVHMIGSSFSFLSLVISVCTIAIIMLGKKYCPKVPMSVVVMVIGVLLSVVFKIEDHGVHMLSDVERGLGRLSIPSAVGFDLKSLILPSFAVAAVITAETLLTSQELALQDGYKLDKNKEIHAYAVGNLMAALAGCCPVNGSVSRTNIIRQFGSKSQWMSIAASFAMVCILLFFTGFIKYLPVPVLTSVVVTALYNSCEFELGSKLFKTSKTEFLIYIFALAGVLLFGTIYGVMIGVLLSFIDVIRKTVTPPRAFMGVIPGRTELFNLTNSKDVYPIKHVVIYRFVGNLFFANIDTFQDDIYNAIKLDTKAVIVNASAIGSIDITAAERLGIMYEDLKQKEIKFYFAGHLASINDELRTFGEEKLIEEGCTRISVRLALADAGYKMPYKLENYDDDSSAAKKRINNVIDLIKYKGNSEAELDWAFGDKSEEKKKQLEEQMVENFENLKGVPIERLVSVLERNSFGKMNLIDEDEFLDRIETHLDKLAGKTAYGIEELEEAIENRRQEVEESLHDVEFDALKKAHERKAMIEARIKEESPEVYERLKERRNIHLHKLNEKYPGVGTKLKEIYKNNDI